MTGFATTAGPFQDALRTNLAARPGLVGWVITTGWVNDKIAGQKNMWFQGIQTGDEGYVAIGQRRIDEGYELIGVIWSQVAGNDEAEIKAARDAAEAAYSELVDELRGNGSQGIPAVQTNSQVTTFSEANTITGDGQGRLCRIDFTISVKASITST